MVNFVGFYTRSSSNVKPQNNMDQSTMWMLEELVSEDSAEC